MLRRHVPESGRVPLHGQQRSDGHVQVRPHLCSRTWRVRYYCNDLTSFHCPTSSDPSFFPNIAAWGTTFTSCWSGCGRFTSTTPTTRGLSKRNSLTIRKSRMWIRATGTAVTLRLDLSALWKCVGSGIWKNEHRSLRSSDNCTSCATVCVAKNPRHLPPHRLKGAKRGQAILVAGDLGSCETCRPTFGLSLLQTHDSIVCLRRHRVVLRSDPFRKVISLSSHRCSHSIESDVL